MDDRTVQQRGLKRVMTAMIRKGSGNKGGISKSVPQPHFPKGIGNIEISIGAKTVVRRSQCNFKSLRMRQRSDLSRALGMARRNDHQSFVFFKGAFMCLNQGRILPRMR